MSIKLSDHFTYGRLARFIMPSVIMMIFTSIYGVVDGLFVSNLVGKTPFAAVNLIMPVLMMFGVAGFMLGTGGSAVVSKTLGEGRHETALDYFSMIVASSAICGVVLAAVGIALMPVIARMIGAEGKTLELCVCYGRIIQAALPFFMLQNVFQCFFVTAGKPKLGLAITVAAGVTNMILDLVLIGILGMGIAGAALATAFSQFVGGGIPLIYFFSKNSSLLRFVRPHFHGKVLLKACLNGSSEFMTNISMSLVNTLYNLQLMKLIGENGVAAYGVIMYVNFIFCAIFFGYSLGSAPIVGYNYGAENHDELKNLFKKSMLIIGVCGIVLTACALLLADMLSGMFVGYDKELHATTVRGFSIYSLSFVIIGFNIFGSSFFTALGNGIASAAISFFRTFVFQIIAVLALPLLLGLDGIWFAVVAAEAASLFITATLLIRLRAKYHY